MPKTNTIVNNTLGSEEVWSLPLQNTSDMTITLPEINLDLDSYNMGTTSFSTNSFANYSGYTISDNAYQVSIHESGITMKADADIKIGDRSLVKSIEKIEERLGILHPNDELESKWEELREMGKKYKELEADLIEKEKMWKILKDNK